jgi:hypothetical protein
LIKDDDAEIIVPEASTLLPAADMNDTWEQNTEDIWDVPQ